jgi:hypothetical protein
VDEPKTNQLLFQFDKFLATLFKSPDLGALLHLLAGDPQVRRLFDLVGLISRPQAISPEPGDDFPASGSITITFSVGNPNATYTVNIVDANGVVVYSCANVPINLMTLVGTCVVPAGTLSPGMNYTVEVVTNGSGYQTITWFSTT